MSVETTLPRDIKATLRRAKKLEAVTIAYLFTAIVAVGLAMGSSQAMKTAWLDDLFSLVPPIAFLVSRRIAKKPATRKHPYGFSGAASIAYLASSLALVGMGLFLAIDAVIKLIEAEHATIASAKVFGHLTWAGWPMIAAALWSGIPAYFLGREKKRLARKLHDHGLLADAEIAEADWMTAAAAIGGVLGIGIGLWWADSAAALFIAADILWDGAKSTRRAVNDLMDRIPIDFDGGDDPLLARMEAEVDRLSWVKERDVRLRAEGHFVVGEVFVVPARRDDVLNDAHRTRERLRALDWRLLDVVVAPVPKLP